MATKRRNAGDSKPSKRGNPADSKRANPDWGAIKEKAKHYAKKGAEHGGRLARKGAEHAGRLAKRGADRAREHAQQKLCDQSLVKERDDLKAQVADLNAELDKYEAEAQRRHAATRPNPADSKRRPRARKNGLAAVAIGGAAAGAASAAASKATEKAIERRERRQRAARAKPKAPRRGMRTSVVRNPGGEPVEQVTDFGGMVDPTVIVMVLPDGRRVRSNPGTKMGGALLRPHWLPLRRGGEWNLEVREALRGKSGVYAIRRKGAAQPLFVGESHKGRGADDRDRFTRTVLRHFQAPDSGFSPSNWTYRSPDDLEIALWTTPAKEAREVQGRAVALLHPTKNRRKFRGGSLDADRL